MDSDVDFENELDEAEDEDDNSELEDDEKRLVEERAYQRCLPDVMRLVRELCGEHKPNLFTDKGEKSCPICPSAQWFKGWKALLAHAANYKKKRPQQHRGYHRALMEALRVTERPVEEDNQYQGRAVSLNPEATKNHLIVWPPIVVAEIVYSESGESFERLLKEDLQNLHPRHIVPVPVNSSHEWRSIILFEASAMGYLEAKRLANRLAERRRGRVYGYLAEPKDMRAIDPSRQLVHDWTEESYYEKVQSAQKKSKQEHDKEQAMLKAMELQVENLTEDELKFKQNKEHMERLIQFKQNEIEAQEKRGREMEQRFQEAMCNLDRNFQTETKSFDAISNARVKRLREQMEASERRLEEVRSFQMKEVEDLEQQFLALTEDLKKQEAQKALERKREAMQKRKNFKVEMEKAEVVFNERARQQESALQEQQHKEMMALMEAATREKEQLLKEWLEQQETLKQKGLEAKQMNEQLPKNAAEQSNECAVCWDTLSEDNRALVKPCGHATVCIGCAKDIYKSTKLCPMCRQQMKQQPIILPKTLYM